MTYSRWEVGGHVVWTSYLSSTWAPGMQIWQVGGQGLCPRVHGHVYNTAWRATCGLGVFCLNEGCGYTEDALPDALPGFLPRPRPGSVSGRGSDCRGWAHSPRPSQLSLTFDL